MKKFKKILFTGLAAAMVVGLTACGSSSETTDSESSMGPSLTKITESGVLTVGIDAGFPPFSFVDPATGDNYGIAVDIAQGVADELGVELKVIPESFGTLLSDLQTDKLDLVAACVTVTDERKEVMAFSQPYIQTGDCFVVRTEDADKYTDVASFEGTTIAANNGTTQYKNASSVEGATVVACESTSDAVLQVTSGTVDAVVVDNVNGKQYVVASEGALTMIETATFTFADKAIGIQLENEDLVAIVNKVIDSVSPEMDGMIDKYTELSVELLGV